MLRCPGQRRLRDQEREGQSGRKGIPEPSAREPHRIVHRGYVSTAEMGFAEIGRTGAVRTRQFPKTAFTYRERMKWCDLRQIAALSRVRRRAGKAKSDDYC